MPRPTRTAASGCGQGRRERLGLAATTARTIVSHDVDTTRGYMAAVPETRSEVVVPIIDGSVVIGLVSSESDERGHYNHSRVELLEEWQARSDG